MTPGRDVEAPTLRTLVLGTDGSADARLARRAVADIARGAGATVHVVGGWNLEMASLGAPLQSIPQELPNAVVEAETAGVVEPERRALEEAGVRATGHAVRGRAADAILEVADREAADLVVVGSRGHGTVGRLLLGSVSDAVIRQAAHPVLTVRGGDEAWPPQGIVAGYDGSPESVAAVRLGALLAVTVGARLTVLEVMPRSEERAVELEGVRAWQVLEGRRGQLEEYLLAGPMAWAPPGWEVRVEPGDPTLVLLEAAGRRPSIVAVGRRGIGRVREAFLGSVSTKLIHTAPGPVLVVPHRSADGSGSPAIP